MVVCKGGDRVLLNHRQTSLADHISNRAILKTLGISRYVAPLSIRKSHHYLYGHMTLSVWSHDFICMVT